MVMTEQSCTGRRICTGHIALLWHFHITRLTLSYHVILKVGFKMLKVHMTAQYRPAWP